MTGVLPFGKYLLDAEIARGGMARVFRARLRGLGGFEKVLVVKQILPELALDPRFIDMFVREANTLVQMNHPNIVPVYELGVIDGVYFLAMEHVEGATLADMIAHNGALAPELVAHLGVQICEALNYAHEKFGVVHRDVTPRNIIIDSTGHARLLDFGIAAPAEGTATQEIFGSHGYMAKEQIRGETLTPAADVFTLGASLFEAFTGTPAFRRENAAASQAAILVEGGPHFADVAAVPEELREVLDRTFSRDAALRPHVTQELGRKLRTWLSAKHPEGVTDALGQLAESARNGPTKKILSPEPQSPATHEREPSGVVRTLATSRILDAMLDASNVAPSPGTERMPSRTTPAVAKPIVAVEAKAYAPRGPQPSPTKRYVFGGIVLALLAAAIAITLRATSDDTDSIPLHAARSNDVAPRAEPEHHVSVVAPQTTPHDAGVARVDAAAADSPSAMTPLSVNALPWAEVRLDGRAVGTTPRRQLSVSAGSHVLELSCPPLGREVRVPFHAVPGHPVQVIVNLNTDPPDVRVR